MLKRLVAEDHTMVMEFLLQQADVNLFMIGDLENFGYEQSFQDVWGCLDAKNRLQGVLLRYHENLLISSPNHAPFEEFRPVLLMYARMTLQGTPETLHGLPGIHDQTAIIKPYHFACLPDWEHFHPCHEQYPIRKAMVSDAAGIAYLQSLIEEFEESPTAEQIERRLQVSGRAFIYEENGMILSCACTTAENSRSAMIVSVMTHPDARGRGFASACVSRLCSELLNEGRRLCLFYDNPAAGSIYHRIGFSDLTQWLRVKNFI